MNQSRPICFDFHFEKCTAKHEHNCWSQNTIVYLFIIFIQHRGVVLSVAMATAIGGWVLPQGVVTFNLDNGRGNSGVQRGKRQTVLDRVMCIATLVLLAFNARF